MLMRPPPTAPYWPAYPEPERSRLEAAYRAEHAKYCAEIDRELTIQMIVAGVSGMAMAALLLWNFT